MLNLGHATGASLKEGRVQVNPHEDQNAERKEYGNDLHEVSLVGKHGVDNALELL